MDPSVVSAHEDRSQSETADAQVGRCPPDEVVACLKNARFLHLATCDELYPHVSLMNYTYLPSSPYTDHPTIIMTSDPSSRKTQNLIRNPRVSLLVHDWVSHRPPTTATEPQSLSSMTSMPPRSSLASLLLNLNTSAISRISTTINGTATLVETDTEMERYYKEKHLENNTFGEESAENPHAPGDGGRGCYIEDDDVRVVVVQIRHGRTADWKGAVKDWRLIGLDDDPVTDQRPNGVWHP